MEQPPKASGKKKNSFFAAEGDTTVGGIPETDGVAFAKVSEKGVLEKRFAARAAQSGC